MIRKIEEGPPLPNGERILLRKRQHWFMLAIPVLFTFIIGLIVIVSLFYLLVLKLNNVSIFISSSLVILLLVSSIIIKLMVDWHCHFYILTTHRILEVSYKPLFSNYINNVILNQVKSTEIDVEKSGLINQILDMGNVYVTFDRPTHGELFSLLNIQSPRSVGFLMSEVLDIEKRDFMKTPLWYKSDDEKKPFRITEEIFPGKILGAI
ncbi:MAG: hypothetical protein A2629_01600 [Candidatus Levybacteria bacterium RIFCSPHIGHO2_01_FULL_41_15]|nr:MAG: hypothetical protein A2629_01600 [Candidatus Levybacteria bacterium RIFCSPHIGHO2_01_FULL_41_15]